MVSAVHYVCPDIPPELPAVRTTNFAVICSFRTSRSILVAFLLVGICHPTQCILANNPAGLSASPPRLFMVQLVWTVSTYSTTRGICLNPPTGTFPPTVPLRHLEGTGLEPDFCSRYYTYNLGKLHVHLFLKQTMLVYRRSGHNSNISPTNSRLLFYRALFGVMVQSWKP